MVVALLSCVLIIQAHMPVGDAPIVDQSSGGNMWQME